jgi:hypothetical protein
VDMHRPIAQSDGEVGEGWVVEVVLEEVEGHDCGVGFGM